MIQENLKDLPIQYLNISLNFVELFNSRKVINNFKLKFPKLDVKQDFYKIKAEQ